MDAVEFARTKIQPPRLRPGLVERPRVEQPLADALSRQRLVLLAAPAGFGKTALLTRALATLPPGTAVAWVACDADDDLARLAGCIAAALDPFDLPWRTSPMALVSALDGDHEALRAVAGEFVNALFATEVPRGLVVLEDIHRIEDPRVFEFLEALIERLPPQWGFVFATRVDPPLGLARWRARGEVAEFRQDLLRFTEEEAQRLVEALPPVPGLEAAHDLVARTDGWAAGLRLLLGSAREGTALRRGAGQRHLFDYLASEVFEAMDSALRLFLLRCSVLPELSAERCAIVAAEPRAGELLEQVEKRGLFVSSIGERELVLRLHDLFRDFLDDRLRRDHALELPQLLERAARTETDPVRRVGYLLQAEAWQPAEEALEAIGAGLVAAGSVGQVLRLIDQFPAEWREQSPVLDHLRGLCAWAHWDIVTMVGSLERAATGFDQRDEVEAAQRARALAVIGLTASGGVPQAIALLARVRQGPMDGYTATTAAQASAWHALATQRFDAAAPALSHMVDLLENTRDPMLWFQCVPPTLMMGLPGTQGPMQRYVDGARARTPADPPTPLRVLAEILRAGLATWSGDTASAAALLREAADDCRWLNQPPNLVGHLHTYGAIAHAVCGDRQAALAAADARLAGLLDDPRTSGRQAVWLSHFLYFKLRIAAALDDTATQRALVERLTAQKLSAEPPLLLQERAPLAARQALLDARWDDAVRLGGEVLAQDAAIDLYGQAAELRLRIAHAWLVLGRPGEAAAVLQPVFARVAAGAAPGGVLLAGPAALETLARAGWGHVLDGAQQRLLQRWAALVGTCAMPPPAVSPASPASANAPAAQAPQPAAAALAADGPLSGREREVLARLAAGDSNKLIARALDLSPHTVKRHVANILDKLGLESRGQAAAWHRARPGA